MIAFAVLGAFLFGLAIDQRGPREIVNRARFSEACAAVACVVAACVLSAMGYR